MVSQDRGDIVDADFSSVTQGGDWGFKVTRFIGIRYPEHCLASHLNLVLAKPPREDGSSQGDTSQISDAQAALEKKWQERTDWFAQEGMGYNILQSTKPATIGFALADSPVALLAWIWEKLHDWSDDYPWTDDEILTWVSIYQFSTAGPAASARIYYDVQSAAARPFSDQVLEYNEKVPLGLSYFPKDIFIPPMSWGRTLGPVVFEGVHDDGGHFAAHERPEALARDMREMFSSEKLSTVTRIFGEADCTPK
jgi:pimeloyl-ACP methyl ester carboxylesterase